MANTGKQVDSTKLRYVLYARKSSEENGAQARSIGDQIAVCQEYAKSNHLRVVKIIKEQKSAKIPNERPEFRRMIDDIKKGEYDGILFWHPDRLARNMLEAGEIIDLLDNKIIKDLKCPTFPYEDDSSGKMMLGMLFVFAKQYSEHLSESVSRGNARNLEEGKSAGTPKWGYKRNSDKRYVPDNNFDLIKQGWEMRANGSSLKEILEFWKDNDVHRMTKDNSRKGTVVRKIELTNKATVSKIFRDPFYYGILCQSGKEVDLTELYDFKPMINKETYTQVQLLSGTRTNTTIANQSKTFYPFRQMVVCAECGKRMSVGAATNRKGARYLYFRCYNKECKRKPRDVRARVILDALYKEIDKLEFTEKEYKQFNKHWNTYSEKERQELQHNKLSRKAKLAEFQSKFDKLSANYTEISETLSEKARKSVLAKMNELENKITVLDNEIKDIEKQLENPMKLQTNKEDFLNILKSLSFKMRNGVPAQKDNLARILLLNIQINDKKEATFLWKEPFATLIKMKNVQTGAPD